MCVPVLDGIQRNGQRRTQSDLCTFIAVIKQKMKLISGDSGYFFFLVGLFQAELVQIFQSLLLALFFFSPSTVNRA